MRPSVMPAIVPEVQILVPPPEVFVPTEVQIHVPPPEVSEVQVLVPPPEVSEVMPPAHTGQK